MTADSAPTLAKWPFLLGDLLFVGLAALIVQMSVHPLALWQIAACVICLGAGAWLAVVPYLKEYEAAVHLASPDALALVRFGLRAPDDPRIVDTVRVIDRSLRVDLPAGPAWHRGPS